jgi:hypothetical protein
MIGRMFPPQGYGTETEPLSYIVFIDDDGYIKSKNCKTGRIDFSGTDAATILNSTINALPNGGKIFIKAGEYALTQKVYLKSNIWISGEGMNTKFRKLNANAILYGMNVENVVLENFYFDSNNLSAQNQANAYASCIGFDSDGTRPLYNIVIRNVKTYNAYAGAHIHFYGRDSTLENVYRQVLLENVECAVSNVYNNPLLILDYVNGGTLIHCYTHDNQDGGISLNGKNLTAINCRAENVTEGIRTELLAGGGNIRIIGGYFAYCTRGLDLLRYTVVKGAVVYRAKAGGIRIWGNSVIEDCWVQETGYNYNNFVRGISVTGNNVIVRGCTVYNTGFLQSPVENSGIVVNGDISNVKVVENTIIEDRSPPCTRWGIEIRKYTFTNIICRDNIIIGFGNTGAGQSPLAITYGAVVHGIIENNINYDSKNFKKTNLSVAVGTDNTYGSATSITSRSLRITYPKIRITIGGTLASGEVITVKIEAVYSDSTTAYIEKSYTETGSEWISDDDVLNIISDTRDITKLNIYAKTNQTSTSATVTVNAYGRG